MATQIRVGDRVTCKFYNSIEKVFYGDRWAGEVIAIDMTKTTGSGTSTPYYIKRDNGLPDVWLGSNEILGILG